MFSAACTNSRLPNSHAREQRSNASQTRRRKHRARSDSSIGVVYSREQLVLCKCAASASGLFAVCRESAHAFRSLAARFVRQSVRNHTHDNTHDECVKHSPVSAIHPSTNFVFSFRLCASVLLVFRAAAFSVWCVCRTNAQTLTGLITHTHAHTRTHVRTIDTLASRRLKHPHRRDTNTHANTRFPPPPNQRITQAFFFTAPFSVVILNDVLMGC